MFSIGYDAAKAKFLLNCLDEVYVRAAAFIDQDEVFGLDSNT